MLNSSRSSLGMLLNSKPEDKFERSQNTRPDSATTWLALQRKRLTEVKQEVERGRLTPAFIKETDLRSQTDFTQFNNRQ
ncbi:uncharacterized [Tachysurus ichikawai]